MSSISLKWVIALVFSLKKYFFIFFLGIKTRITFEELQNMSSASPSKLQQLLSAFSSVSSVLPGPFYSSETAHSDPSPSRASSAPPAATLVEELIVESFSMGAALGGDEAADVSEAHEVTQEELEESARNVSPSLEELEMDDWVIVPMSLDMPEVDVNSISEIKKIMQELKEEVGKLSTAQDFNQVQTDLVRVAQELKAKYTGAAWYHIFTSFVLVGIPFWWRASSQHVEAQALAGEVEELAKQAEQLAIMVSLVEKFIQACIESEVPYEGTSLEEIQRYPKNFNAIVAKIKAKSWRFSESELKIIDSFRAASEDNAIKKELTLSHIFDEAPNEYTRHCIHQAIAIYEEMQSQISPKDVVVVDGWHFVPVVSIHPRVLNVFNAKIEEKLPLMLRLAASGSVEEMGRQGFLIMIAILGWERTRALYEASFEVAKEQRQRMHPQETEEEQTTFILSGFYRELALLWICYNKAEARMERSNSMVVVQRGNIYKSIFHLAKENLQQISGDHGIFVTSQFMEDFNRSHYTVNGELSLVPHLVRYVPFVTGEACQAQLEKDFPSVLTSEIDNLFFAFEEGYRNLYRYINVFALREAGKVDEKFKCFKEAWEKERPREQKFALEHFATRYQKLVAIMRQKFNLEEEDPAIQQIEKVVSQLGQLSRQKEIREEHKRAIGQEIDGLRDLVRPYYLQEYKRKLGKEITYYQDLYTYFERIFSYSRPELKRFEELKDLLSRFAALDFPTTEQVERFTQARAEFYNILLDCFLHHVYEVCNLPYESITEISRIGCQTVFHHILNLAMMNMQFFTERLPASIDKTRLKPFFAHKLIQVEGTAYSINLPVEIVRNSDNTVSVRATSFIRLLPKDEEGDVAERLASDPDDEYAFLAYGSVEYEVNITEGKSTATFRRFSDVQEFKRAVVDAYKKRDIADWLACSMNV